MFCTQLREKQKSNSDFLRVRWFGARIRVLGTFVCISAFVPFSTNRFLIYFLSLSNWRTYFILISAAVPMETESQRIHLFRPRCPVTFTENQTMEKLNSRSHSERRRRQWQIKIIRGLASHRRWLLACVCQ